MKVRKNKMKNLIENQKDSFILYTSFYELYFEELSNEEKGILIDAIFHYVQTGRTDFEEINRDRGLKISFKTMVDQIQRNIVKYNDIREKRQKAARDRWSKKQTGDSRTIEMPGDSALVMRGKISNMPKDISEFISRTGYTDFENIRSFNEYCNFHGWASSLESMQKAYEDWKADNE